jgi:hypothetical protein
MHLYIREVVIVSMAQATVENPNLADVYRRIPTLGIDLPAKAGRAGGIEEVAVAPSLHRRNLEKPYE